MKTGQEIKLPPGFAITPESMLAARQAVAAEEAAKQMPLKAFTPFPSRD